MIGNSEYMPSELPAPISVDASRRDMLVQAYNKAKAKGTLNIFSKDGLKNGKSIAFGAYLGLDVRVGGFPITVSAGADIGFDVLLTRNRPDCDGFATEDAINNWYLLGQFYAGVAAKVGFSFKEDGKVWQIFDAGVAVLIQAGAFGPTIGIGAWVVKYKILFISGSASGTFEFGESCLDYQSTFDPEKLVSGIYGTTPIGSPDDKVVSINSNFVLDCAVSPNREVIEEMVDFKTGESETLRLKVNLEAELTDDQGRVIETNNRTDGASLVVSPKQMLTPGSQVTLSVKGEALDLGPDPDVLYVNNGKTYKVDTSVTFTVDPKGILGLSLEDVAVSYPLSDQKYFHIDEHDQMMIDFGKVLPISGASFSSRMERAFVAPGAAPAETGNGSWELLSEGSLTVSGDGKKLIDPKYEAWEPEQNYRWVISAKVGEDEPEDLIKIKFNSSKFRTFAEKAETASVADPQWEDANGPMKITIESNEEPFDFESDRLTKALHTTDQDGAFNYWGKVRNWVPYGACKLFRCQAKEDDQFVPTGEGANINYEWASISVGSFTEIALSPASETATFTYDVRKNFLSTYQDLVLESKRGGLQQCIDIKTYETCPSNANNNPLNRDGTPNPNYNPSPSPIIRENGSPDAKGVSARDFPAYSTGNYPIKLVYRIPGFNKTSDTDKIINFYRP